MKCYRWPSLLSLLIAISLFGLTDLGAANAGGRHKALIYPAAGDSLGQLKQTFSGKVHNYGAYWLVEASDVELTALRGRYGERVHKSDYLNIIELATIAVDTAAGEPSIPADWRETPASGRRLRLIQFGGPVVPEWLDAVKALGVRIVNYIPHNAYLVRLDEAAEAKLQALVEPAGPIQWIGSYHPYYKVASSLLQSPEPQLEIQVAVADDADAATAVRRIQNHDHGLGSEPYSLGGQQIIHLLANRGDLPAIARLPEVLWIDQVFPAEPRDEVQALVMASRISQLPGHSPVPGVDDYLDFLTNQLGFSSSSAEYPVLSVADFGYLSHDDIDFEFGDPLNPSRSAGLVLTCPPPNCFSQHSTLVLSSAIGYNDGADPSSLDADGFRFGIGVSPFGRWSNVVIYGPETDCPLCHSTNSLAGIASVQYGVTRARIANNSWSAGAADGSYSSGSLSYDVGVRDILGTGTGGTPGASPLNQEIIVVFAAGGTGAGGNNGGFGDVQTVAPATAKNVISVGASESPRDPSDALACGGVLFPDDADDSFDVAYLSPFGPTQDGRIKPEIVAPGTAIHGPFGGTNLISNFYMCSSGTSYSAPAVSGAIQLLWWWFENHLTDFAGQNLIQPTPAMAKAYLCNAARYLPITNPQTGTTDTLPSTAQGMGIVDLARMFDSVPRVVRDQTTPRAIDSPLIVTNPVSQQTYFTRSGQTYELSGNVFDATKPFRVTLAWTDAPGSPASFQQLVNDLDLQLTIGNKIYRGNNFAGANSITGGNFDGLNNLESVHLPAGQTGRWTVVVRALNIAADAVSNVGSDLDQDFALVVYNSDPAEPPSDIPDITTNDTCSTAIAFDSFPVSFTNNLTRAVYHNTHPSPSAARGGVEEFFKLVEPTPGTSYTIDTLGSNFDTVLSIWRVQVIPKTGPVAGECGALIEMLSANDTSGLQEQLSFTADGSNTYYIVVEPHNNGNGGQMVLNVQAVLPPISVSPISLDFGGVNLGESGDSRVVTYSNNTSVPVQITDVSITGSNANDFVIMTQTCADSIIPPGGQCTVTLFFAPTDIDLRTAQLEFHDTATGSPRVVPLSGFGLPPVPKVCVSVASPVLFTNTFVGNLSSDSPKSIVITNCGSAALNVTNLTVTGNASADFAVVENCVGSIAPGATCSLDVSFLPLTNGTRQATITLFDDAEGSPHQIIVRGNAFLTGPDLCLSPSLLTFESTGVGTTSTPLSVTITNCGTAPLTIGGLGFQGANPGDFFVDSSTCAVLTTGQTCEVSVGFSPTAGGLRTAQLSITNNAPGSPHVVNLQGGGIFSQPDALVGLKAKLHKLIGDDVINLTGVDQTIAAKVKRKPADKLKARKVYVAVQNQGSIDDSFTIQGPAVGGWTIRYFLGAEADVEVTSQVLAGTFSTSTLAAGAVQGDATMLRVEISADRDVLPKGATSLLLLTVSSASNPTRQDVIGIQAIAK